MKPFPSSLRPLLSSAQALPQRVWRPPVRQRVWRGAACALLAFGLGGCAVWDRIFGPDDAPTPAPAAQAAPAPVSAAPVPSTMAEPQAAMPPVAPGTPVPSHQVRPSSEAPGTMPPSPPLSDIAMAPAPSPAPAPVAHAARADAAQGKPGAQGGAAPKGPGYYINVGLFAVPDNAKKAVHTLQTAGQAVFTEAVRSKKGALTRVRVGPFAQRAQADAAAAKIKTLHLDAVVFQRR